MIDLEFNINALDYENNIRVNDAFDLFFRFNHLPLITKPTRVTQNSANVVDHIITNDYIQNLPNAKVITLDISDHFPIFIFSTETITQPSARKYVEHEKRNINKDTINHFQT